MWILQYSLIINCILLFCLFAPNIVYLIHKKHFSWRTNEKLYTKKEVIDLLKQYRGWAWKIDNGLSLHDLQRWIKENLK